VPAAVFFGAASQVQAVGEGSEVLKAVKVVARDRVPGAVKNQLRAMVGEKLADPCMVTEVAIDQG
jgi:hypothetical protein